jgi:uncharacterized protein YcfL
MKKLLMFALAAFVLAACSSVPAQPWQPKSHPPATKKYGKRH